MLSDSFIQQIDLVIVSMALAVALFAAATLLADRRVAPRSGGLVLFMAVAVHAQLDDLVLKLGGYGSQLWLAALPVITTLLYGPSIYLYIRAMTGKGTTPRRRMIALGVPLLIGLVPFALFITQPQPAIVEMLADKPITDPTSARIISAAMPVTLAAFFSVALVSLVASWRLLDENLQTVRGAFSNIEDRTMSWLRVMIIVLMFAVGMSAVLPILQSAGFDGAWQDPASSAVALVMIAFLAFYGVRQRPTDLPADAPQGAADMAPSAALAEVPGAAPNGHKYARSALDAPRMERLAARLRAAMDMDGLHRDPTLSLRALSAHLGAPTNYISQTLNEQIGMNFFDFVNSYRVEEACKRLRESDESVTAVALAVGFNSRSTFNAAFRKHKNAAPSEWRKTRPAPRPA